MAKKIGNSLKEKMAQSVAGSAPSMVPVPHKVPQAPEPEEIVPKLEDLIGDNDGDDRDTLRSLIESRLVIDAQLKPLESLKENMTNRIKAMLSGYGITQMLCSGAKVSYTVTERKSLNQMKLLEAGVTIDTITECTDITKGSMLKITSAKE